MSARALLRRQFRRAHELLNATIERLTPDRSDYAVALKLVDLGLLRYSASEHLADLRRPALDRLRELHQQPDPFKFIIYS